MGYCPDIKSADCQSDNLGDIVKHKHCEVIKAWADGKTIQFNTHIEGQWLDCDNPRWFIDQSYRVKPETVRYRIGLMQYPGGKLFTLTAESEDHEERWERKPSFIRWLTDWQEVEV